LDGGDQQAGWGRVMMWRSKWFDLFLKNERIEAMELVWGMMAWLMRSQQPTEESIDSVEGDNKMDVS
jgi:hypothetical protein